MPSFVYNSAGSLPGTRSLFQLRRGNLCGASPFERCPFPDVYSITFLTNSHAAKGMAPCFQKGLEHIAGTSPLSLGVGPFGKLLEDDGSGRKALSGIFWIQDVEPTQNLSVPQAGTTSGKKMKSLAM